MFKVLFAQRAIDNMRAISNEIALQIKKRIYNYLAKSPQKLGKSLQGKYNGLHRYRYRYGDYRVI